MNLINSIRLFPLAGVVAVGLAFHSTTGLAQIQVGPAGGRTTSTQHGFRPEYNAWFVADLSDPLAPAAIQVIPGIHSGGWNQELGFDPTTPALATGDSWELQQLLRFGEGQFAVEQWTLEILTSGWRWGEFNLFDSATSEPVAGLGRSLSFTGQFLIFAFNPSAPKNDVFMVASLDYSGPDGAQPSPILIQAVATIPEPESAALLALGLAALLVHALHRRSRQPTFRAFP